MTAPDHNRFTAEDGRTPLRSVPTGDASGMAGHAEAPRGSPPTTCIEHQAGRPTQRLSFQIKVF